MASKRSAEESPSILADNHFNLSDRNKTVCNSPFVYDELVFIPETPINLWQSPTFRFVAIVCVLEQNI